MYHSGLIIGPYTLINRIGRGGFGEVWLAERLAKFATTKVAIKFPFEEQINLEAIRQEATLWQQASGHPNIIPLLEANEYQGQIVIVSEYAPDGTLEQWLRKNGKMPVERAVHTTIGILNGLEFLHNRRIIHRDLKPANILLQDATPRLADFGISRAVRSTVSSQSQNISGTFAYMSPEAFDGRRSYQTDIWAVGVILYRLLTNALPFPQPEPSSLMMAIMMKEFAPLPDFVQAVLRNVLAKALAKDPEQRYCTASEMRQDLLYVLYGRQHSVLTSNSPDQIGNPILPNAVQPSLYDGEVETVVNLPRVPEDTGDTGDSGPQLHGSFVLPDSDLLTPAPPYAEKGDDELLDVARKITEKYAEFNVSGRVVHILQGPVVTTYEFKPDAGVKYSRITSLNEDLCLALSAEAIRINRIPGKEFVGIEVPNFEHDKIYLQNVIEGKKFRESNSPTTVALGKTIDGINYVSDLAKMPHLLIAGPTGVGKSVSINALIMSILFKARPEEVKFILIDPKQVELGIYADIPHLATPVITDPKRAVISLKWAVLEMEKRYKNLASWDVRNIESFNSEIKKRNAAGYFDDKNKPWLPLPYILIVIDELADLMMVSREEAEEAISRIAQKGAGAGVHLVISTQRPLSYLNPGLIKENFFSKMLFRVWSKTDSRNILGEEGAEFLTPNGDVLFRHAGSSEVVRIHVPFADDREISNVVAFVKRQAEPDYKNVNNSSEDGENSEDLPGAKDPLFADALRSVVSAKRASTSLLQRHLRISYGRAAAILDAMVRMGFIGELDGSTRARPIQEKAYQYLKNLDENL